MTRIQALPRQSQSDNDAVRKQRRLQARLQTTHQPPLSAMPFTIIVAMDRQRGIGIRNSLPWHLPEDLAHFKRTTTGHPIIMGRKTFESIGRPLPNRRNIVVTRNRSWQHVGVEVVASLDQAAQLTAGQQAFVIGGAQIYEHALPMTNRLIVTEIDQTFDCDTFLPPLDASVWKETARTPHRSEKNGFEYAFVQYEKA